MKRMFALILAVVMTLSLAACGNQPADNGVTNTDTPPEKVFEWKIASVYQDPVAAKEFNSYGAGEQYFCDILNERSGGRIHITPYYSSVLGTNNEIFEQCQSGELEVFLGQPNSNYDPRFAAWSIPYLFQNKEEIRAIACDPNGAVFQNSKAWLADHDMELIGVGVSCMRGFINSKKEVKTADDLKGMSVRTYQDTIVTSFWSGLCSATPLSMADVYTSLQTGVIDGLEFSGDAAISQKFYEVCKYYSDIDWQWNSGFNLVVSKKAWDQLPDDLKEIVRECGEEAANYQSDLVIEETPKAKAILESNGVAYHELTDAERQTFIDYAESTYGEIENLIGEDVFNSMFEAVEAYRAAK